MSHCKIIRLEKTVYSFQLIGIRVASKSQPEKRSTKPPTAFSSHRPRAVLLSDKPKCGSVDHLETIMKEWLSKCTRTGRRTLHLLIELWRVVSSKCWICGLYKRKNTSAQLLSELVTTPRVKGYNRLCSWGRRIIFHWTRLIYLIWIRRMVKLKGFSGKRELLETFFCLAILQ